MLTVGSSGEPVFTASPPTQGAARENAAGFETPIATLPSHTLTGHTLPALELEPPLDPASVPEDTPPATNPESPIAPASTDIPKHAPPADDHKTPEPEDPLNNTKDPAPGHNDNVIDSVAKVVPGTTTSVMPKKRKRVIALPASNRTLRERPASQTQQSTPATQYVTSILITVYFP